MTEKTINDRVSAVMTEISRIPKNGKNQYSKYYYATADDVFATIRPLLAKHSLTVKHETQAPLILPTASKDPVVFLPVRVWFDGEAPPEGYIFIPLLFNTPQAVQATVTYAVKYWLRGRLLIDTGEEDADAQSTGESKDQIKVVQMSPIKAGPDGKLEMRDGSDIFENSGNKDILRAIYTAASNEIDANNNNFIFTNLLILRKLPKQGREALAKKLEGHDDLVQALLSEETETKEGEKL